MQQGQTKERKSNAEEAAKEAVETICDFSPETPGGFVAVDLRKNEMGSVDVEHSSWTIDPEADLTEDVNAWFLRQIKIEELAKRYGMREEECAECCGSPCIAVREGNNVTSMAVELAEEKKSREAINYTLKAYMAIVIKGYSGHGYDGNFDIEGLPDCAVRGIQQTMAELKD